MEKKVLMIVIPRNFRDEELREPETIRERESLLRQSLKKVEQNVSEE